MKLRYLLAFLIVFIVLPGIRLNAQGETPIMPDYQRPPIFIGPSVGINRAIHSVELASFAQEICPRFSNGNGNGFFVGLTFEQHFGKEAASSTSSLIFRVLYNTLPASLEVSENPIPSLITQIKGNDTTDIVLNSSTKHTQDIAYNLITAEVMYKINPIPGIPLGFTIGPCFGFATTKTQDQKYVLVSPLEAQFKRNDPVAQQYGYKYVDNDRTIIIKEGDIPNSNPFRLGIKAGVQFEILAGQWVVVPEMFYNFGVTSLSSDVTWRVDAIQMGVDFRYAF